MEETKKKTLQWHPAFYAGLQIEFEDEAENLSFENEHQLGTKPKQIDVLVIKKDTEKPIRKNLGRIFRKHNIVEYKSPEDYLSIDDFYKVFGYTCFYKADTAHTDEIKIKELTISFVCHRHPRKLMKHLEEQGYHVKKADAGIYYIEGLQIPVQLILTSKLSNEENLWLRNLTNDLTEKDTARKMITEYEQHKDDRRYESVMNLITNANVKLFEEVNHMCEALVDIVYRSERWQESVDKAAKEAAKEVAKEMAEKMAEEMAEQMAEEMAEQKVKEMAEQMAKEMAEQKAKEMAEPKAKEATEKSAKKGRIEGAHRVNKLIQNLLATARNGEIERAVTDDAYQQKLFEEFGL